MINPSSPFGGPDTAPAPEPEAVPGRSRRTVVIAVAAGVVALGLLGGTASLVLGGTPATDGTVLPPAAQPVATPEPSASPTAASTPLPTSPVLGRNVFVPLVEPPSSGAAEAAGGTGGASVTGGGEQEAVAQATARPNPTVTVVQTVPVQVPGPTTTVPGPTTTVAGPTRVVELPPTTITVPGADFVDLAITVSEAADGSHPATFFVLEADDTTNTYLDVPEGTSFGEGNRFTYVGYDGSAVSFRYVDSLFTVTAPLVATPTATPTGTAPPSAP